MSNEDDGEEEEDGRCDAEPAAAVSGPSDEPIDAP